MNFQDMNSSNRDFLRLLMI